MDAPVGPFSDLSSARSPILKRTLPVTDVDDYHPRPFTKRVIVFPSKHAYNTHGAVYGLITSLDHAPSPMPTISDKSAQSNSVTSAAFCASALEREKDRLQHKWERRFNRVGIVRFIVTCNGMYHMLSADLSCDRVPEYIERPAIEDTRTAMRGAMIELWVIKDSWRVRRASRMLCERLGVPVATIEVVAISNKAANKASAAHRPE